MGLLQFLACLRWPRDYGKGWSQEKLMFGPTQNWEGGLVLFHELIHASILFWSQTQRLLGWQHGGWKALRLQTLWVEALQFWDRTEEECWLLNAAWHFSRYVKCSLCRSGDAMPGRSGSSPVSAGRKQPAIRRRVSFCATSIFFAAKATTPNWGSIFRLAKDYCKSGCTNSGCTGTHDESVEQRIRLLRTRVF